MGHHNPVVPETLDGWSLLHLMYRVRWPGLKRTSASNHERMAAEFIQAATAAVDGPTAFVQTIGHKADLMVICFRRDFDGLARAQRALAGTELHEHLEPASSYVSVVELGMYEMTAKIHEQLAAAHQPGTEAFDRAFDAEMETQRQRVVSRLFIELPAARHVCFYPMNKRRAEGANWYTEPFARRAAMMREHGMIGRHYAGKVTQIISGSIGFDDWEWGVDLFAADPLVFKKLIYEMRFDEASARFAEFGPFHVGVQLAPADLQRYLSGESVEG